jgi:hypothetical protein
VLLGTVAVALTGCGLRSEPTMIVDHTGILRPILQTAADQAAGYQAAVDSGSGHTETLEMLRANHSEHVTTLAKLTGVSAPEGTAADLGDDPLATLLAAERDAAGQAGTACVETILDYAVVLGEIAACRAAHVDVLEVL